MTPGTTPIRPPRLRSLVAVLGVAVAVVLGTAPAALAHTGLESSDPADGSTVSQPAPAVTLTFSTQVLLKEVTVTGPSGAGAAAGEATADGGVVTQPVALTEPGTHTVTYAVTSSDGHPVEGTLTFTYAPPTTAAPTTEAAAASSPSATPPTRSAAVEPSEAAAADPAERRGVPGWSVAAVAALVLAGVAILLSARRRAGRR